MERSADANTSESEVNRDRSQSREGNDGNGDRFHFSYFSHNAKIRKRF